MQDLSSPGEALQTLIEAASDSLSAVELSRLENIVLTALACRGQGVGGSNQIVNPEPVPETQWSASCRSVSAKTQLNLEIQRLEEAVDRIFPNQSFLLNGGTKTALLTRIEQVREVIPDVKASCFDTRPLDYVKNTLRGYLPFEEAGSVLLIPREHLNVAEYALCELIASGVNFDWVAEVLIMSGMAMKKTDEGDFMVQSKAKDSEHSS
jgi:hypothetical protein